MGVDWDKIPRAEWEKVIKECTDNVDKVISARQDWSILSVEEIQEILKLK